MSLHYTELLPTYPSFTYRGPFKSYGPDDLISSLFLDIEHYDSIGSYDLRNRAVLMLLGEFARLGWESGILIDPKEPEWPVVFFEIVVGSEKRQLSWHLKQYAGLWDGHSTEQKYKSMHEWMEVNRGK